VAVGGAGARCTVTVAATREGKRLTAARSLPQEEEIAIATNLPGHAYRPTSEGQVSGQLRRVYLPLPGVWGGVGPKSATNATFRVILGRSEMQQQRTLRPHIGKLLLLPGPMEAGFAPEQLPVKTFPMVFSVIMK
jgi:hypothetical protein